MPLYDDLVKNYKVHYIAGGAAQNSIRGAQVSCLYDSVDIVRPPAQFNRVRRRCRQRRFRSPTPRSHEKGRSEN